MNLSHMNHINHLFILGEGMSPAGYIILAVLGAIFLYLVIGGLKAKPVDSASRNIPKPETQNSGKTDAEIEAEARRVFEIPHVSVGDDSEASQRPRVRILQTTEATIEPTGELGDADIETISSTPGTEHPVADDPSMEAAGKTLSQGLARTKAGFVAQLGRLFGRKQKVDANLLGELEEALFTADIGVRTSQKLFSMVEENIANGDLTDSDAVWSQLREEIRKMLVLDGHAIDLDTHTPFVIMVVGVNGAGKTTSIGKLASRYRQMGKKVLLAAGDTFRAAAVEQLEVWGQRAEVDVVRGSENQDPSSVIFDACKKAESENYDVIIADTAGRLQAKKELMDELGKVHRVIGKALPGAPHAVWLVLDSTNGQNAISQAKEFTQVVDVSGLVLTKLDGTAKGGVVIGICDEMQLPVHYIGIGESVEDLRPFEPEAFADALFAES